MRALIVTNGHGEDQLAVCLIDGLRAEWPALELEAIPLVGHGDRLRAAGVAVDGPRVIMPSGGMVRPELSTVWGDVRAGLFRKFRRQRQFIRSRRGRVQKIIAVGDVLAGWTAGGALPELPLALVATAKSEYISGHGFVETRWMRRRAQHVFARDERTAAALRDAGVAASWAGNLMMDAFSLTGKTFVEETDPPPRIIGLFPGSRDDAYVNLQHIARALARLGDGAHGHPYVGLVPLAPGLDMERAVALLEREGWQRQSTGTSHDADAHPYRVRLQHNGASLYIVAGAFGDILQAADVVIGLAGTANEQAAGLGKPVVIFEGPGVQFGGRFLRAQKRLLGDAVAVTEPEPAAVAAKVGRIFDDKGLRNRMAKVGRERMGPPGASRRMARAIADLWRSGGV